MKHTLPILALFTLHASLFTLPAAVPLRWTVETSRAQVARRTFPDAVAGAVHQAAPMPFVCQ